MSVAATGVSMKFRGWISSDSHLGRIKDIRNRTHFLKRMIQRYDMPDGFPYAKQGVSQLLAPCESVINIEVDDIFIKLSSSENQSDGMPTAKAVNFKDDVNLSICLKSLKKLTLEAWKSPI